MADSIELCCNDVMVIDVKDGRERGTDNGMNLCMQDS